MFNFLTSELKIAHAQRTLYVAMFWGLASGIYWLLPLFQEWIPLPVYVIVFLGLAVALAIARYKHEPGID